MRTFYEGKLREKDSMLSTASEEKDKLLHKITTMADGDAKQQLQHTLLGKENLIKKLTKEKSELYVRAKRARRPFWVVGGRPPEPPPRPAPSSMRSVANAPPN
jgi:hypothetical protein